MKRRVSAVPIARVFLLAFAALPCMSAWSDAGNVPAVIVHPTAAGRTELAHIVSHALHRDRVRLADDALTTSNFLAIEHALIRDSEGRPLNGRDLRRPETFELFVRNSRCVLVHTQTGTRWILRRSTCAALHATLDSAARSANCSDDSARWMKRPVRSFLA